jgi:hypothetical protein
VQGLLFWCLWLTLGQLPSFGNPGQAHSAANRLKGEALVWCVRAGMSSASVERVFGRPGLRSQFRDSPVAWWYPDLGVTVSFPARLSVPTGPVQQVLGGIE